MGIGTILLILLVILLLGGFSGIGGGPFYGTGYYGGGGLGLSLTTTRETPRTMADNNPIPGSIDGTLIPSHPPHLA